MKVLIVHRYFWPDTPPYASLLRTIAEGLTEDHETHVFTAQPSYGSTNAHERRSRQEELNSIHIRRARLLPESKANMVGRAINLVLFSVQVFMRVLLGRFDAVMVATTPPVLVSTAASLAGRATGARTIYHCQDIYPEVAIAAGKTEQSSILARVTRRLDTMTMKRVDRIVVLSEDMRRTVSSRSSSLRSKVAIINNFMPDAAHDDSETDATALERVPGMRRIVFAGNLGNFQGLDHVIRAACETEPNLEWLFLGDGAARSRLEGAAGSRLGNIIRFEGRWPQAIAEQVVADADAALVSLDPGVIGSAYPSKTLTYLSVGTPILAVVEEDSELAQTVVEHGVGISAPPGDSAAIARAAEKLVSMPDLDERGERAKAYANANASVETQLALWRDLFAQLASSR